MKKISVWAAALAMTLTASVGTAEMTPGTYVGTAHGVHADVKVALEVNENEILNAWVLEQSDYPIISDKAAEQITRQIVDRQSVRVDALTGATATSYAMMTAAQNALTAAGGDVKAFTKTETKELAEGETEEYDVVVVGAGPAGLTAALSAMTDTNLSVTDSGLKVLVVERMGFGGGSMGFSGGVVASYFGTPLNEATGVSNSIEEIETLFRAWNDSDAVNDTILHKAIEYNAITLNGLMARNFALDVTEAHPQKRGDVTYTVMFSRNPYTGEYLNQNGYYNNGGAAWIGKSLVDLMDDAGVEIRYNTSAVELVVNDNVCTGVVVEDKDSRYRINAKKVILATGYADTNADTSKTIFADRKQVTWAGPIGNQTDAAKWVLEMGGEISVLPSKASIGFSSTQAYFGSANLIVNKMPAMWVNSDGDRFFDESGARSASLLRELEKPTAYIIFDSTHQGVEYMENPIYERYGFKADTIEDLAKQTGIPADELKATIEKYNADYEAGTDSVFGTPIESMSPVKKGPYYALRVCLVATSELASAYADDDCTILLGKDGARIENLLGAGGAIANTYVKDGLGAGLLTAMTTGNYAGECARTAILGE